MRAHRSATKTVIVAALSALIVLLGVARLSSAGFSATTNNPADAWASGTVTITDDDTGTALFDTTANGLLDGGQTLTRCIAVTYTGSLTSDVGVRLHGTATGDLAPHLNLTVEEGTGGSAGTCAGFTPTGTLYTGDLAAFAAARTNFATGVSTWTVTGTPETRTYRIALAVQNTPAAQAKAATGTFTWEAATLPPWSPALLSDARVLLRAKDAGAVGATVATWTDKARNTVFGGPGTGPTVVAATPNGGKALRFGSGIKPLFAATEPNIFDAGTSDADTITSSPWFNANGVNYAPATIAGQAGDWATADATMPVWWQVTLKAPKVVTAYTLSAVNANGRNPKDWQFQGSNDGTTWDTLDTQAGVTGTISNAAYPFANSTAYRHYRLHITAINGGGLAYLTRIDLTGANIAMTQPAEAEIWMVVKANVPASTGNPHPWQVDSEANHFPFSDNRVYDGFGSYRVSFDPVTTIREWRLYRATISASEYRRYVDGVQRFGAAGAARGFKRVPSFGGSFNGDIAEVFIRTKVSDATETAKLITYFNTQHGLTVPGGS